MTNEQPLSSGYIKGDFSQMHPHSEFIVVHMVAGDWMAMACAINLNDGDVHTISSNFDDVNCDECKIGWLTYERDSYRESFEAARRECDVRDEKIGRQKEQITSCTASIRELKKDKRKTSQTVNKLQAQNLRLAEENRSQRQRLDTQSSTIAEQQRALAGKVVNLADVKDAVERLCNVDLDDLFDRRGWPRTSSALSLIRPAQYLINTHGLFTNVSGAVCHWSGFDESATLCGSSKRNDLVTENPQVEVTCPACAQILARNRLLEARPKWVLRDVPIQAQIPLCLKQRRADRKRCSMPYNHIDSEQCYYNLTLSDTELEVLGRRDVL